MSQLLQATVEVTDRVVFREARGFTIVIETGRLGFEASGTDDSIPENYLVVAQAGPVLGGIVEVAPHVAMTHWVHQQSDEDDNEAFNLEHLRWSVVNVSGGEQVRLELPIQVIGEHAFILAADYQLTIKAGKAEDQSGG